MKNTLLLFISFFIFNACQSDKKQNDKIAKPKKETVFDKEIEIIFQDQSNFKNEELELLKELKICNPLEKDLKNHFNPACHPSFFKFFKFNEKKSFKKFIFIID